MTYCFSIQLWKRNPSLIRWHNVLWTPNGLNYIVDKSPHTVGHDGNRTHELVSAFVHHNEWSISEGGFGLTFITKQPITSHLSLYPASRFAASASRRASPSVFSSSRNSFRVWTCSRWNSCRTEISSSEGVILDFYEKGEQATHRVNVLIPLVLSIQSEKLSQGVIEKQFLQPRLLQSNVRRFFALSYLPIITHSKPANESGSIRTMTRDRTLGNSVPKKFFDKFSACWW